MKEKEIFKTTLIVVVLLGVLWFIGTLTPKDPALPINERANFTQEELAVGEKVKEFFFLTLSRTASRDEITIFEVEAVEWNDACLSIEREDQMCAQVITPGYRVTLLFGNSQIIYHTNQDGSFMQFKESFSLEE